MTCMTKLNARRPPCSRHLRGFSGSRRKPNCWLLPWKRCRRRSKRWPGTPPPHLTLRRKPIVWPPLPVDYLKIDGALVQSIIDDDVACTMVEAINRIAYAMDIETIAEFVENDQVLRRLRAIGVDFAQGFGIHVPEPLDGLNAGDRTIAEALSCV